MAALDGYFARKTAALAARQADFTADPGRGIVQIEAASWVAGETGARPVRIGPTQWVTDSAPGLAGNALGPTAPEMLLGALASCLVHTYLIEAALAGLPLERVEVTARAALDMRGVVGLPAAERPRLEQVSYVATLQLALDGPAAADAEARLHTAVEENCPVLNTIKQPVAVRRVE